MKIPVNILYLRRGHTNEVSTWNDVRHEKTREHNVCKGLPELDLRFSRTIV